MREGEDLSIQRMKANRFLEKLQDEARDLQRRAEVWEYMVEIGMSEAIKEVITEDDPDDLIFRVRLYIIKGVIRDIIDHSNLLKEEMDE